MKIDGKLIVVCSNWLGLARIKANANFSSVSLRRGPRILMQQ